MRQIPDTYELVLEQGLPDLRSEGTLLIHRKSGARIALLENEDDNKVFFIGFRTPPVDSKGTAHIIEHSVLCGSEKYPIKDPFVELAKGSMNTFLNAMTYPDKTVYPIASTNDKDFANLMDVYMDAVLHPNIVRHPEIFKQEGWHYELSSPEDEIEISGVVYNEMKGAFSSPEDVLSRTILNTLFPDTPYQYESGGDPEDIPTLTYEEFLEFHRMYYHPCNSYIYLYGDMDMTERLEWLDEAYLSKYDRIDIDSVVAKQEPFAEPIRIEEYYPIASTDDEEDATFLSYNMVIGDSLDAKLCQAFDILDYALLSAPGAPLRKALTDAGIGKDILGGYDDGTLQPMFSVIAKGTQAQKEGEFLRIVKEVLKEQADGGLDHTALLAAINSTEFKVREADYGSYPKGLLYGLDALDSWLYDERAPFVHLDALAVLKELKEELEKGYFEELIRSYLLDNPHASVVVVKPKRGLVQEREEALAKRLAEYKSTLSGEELRTLAEETEHLHIYQDTPSTQEELLTLPLLAREDLKSKVRPIRYEKRSLRGRDHIFCERDTCGVAYLSAIFRISREEEALTPEITFFCHLIGAVDTANYGYGEFANEVNLHSGGLSVNVHIYPKDDGSYDCTLDARAKYLYDEEETVMALFEEMLLQSDFSDRERIRQLLRMEVSSMQVKLMSAGHTLSANRAGSYFADDLKRLDEAGGIAYYEYLKDFEEHFDERIEDFQRLCRALVKRTFTNDRLLTCSICEKEQEDSMEGRILAFAEALEAAQEGSGEDAEKVLRRAAHKTPEEPRINEGICTASQVQYVSCAGNFKKGGFSFNGAWRVLRVLLNYEYFWLNIRVKGGAYGCMSSFQRSGNVTFSSYRDPSLSETYAIFAGTADYLKELIISERDMTKYVIGTVSALDTPLSPSQDGLRSLTSYLTGVDEAMLQKERDEVLACSVEDLRALAEAVRFVTDQGFVCAIGNEEVLKKGASLFNEVISMG